MAYTANKLRARSERRLVDYDPDATTETIVTLNPAASEKCLAIAPGFGSYLAGVMHSVGTGSFTGFKIFAAENAAGTTNATVVASHALGSDPSAVGDTLWLEVSAEQVKAALPTATHIGVKLTQGTAGDECVVFFERAEPRHAYDQLTADYVS